MRETRLYVRATQTVRQRVRGVPVARWFFRGRVGWFRRRLLFRRAEREMERVFHIRQRVELTQQRSTLFRAMFDDDGSFAQIS